MTLRAARSIALMHLADSWVPSITCIYCWWQVPAGGVYSHLAWGPTGQLAAACDNSIHFLDPSTGSIIDAVEAAHDAAISSLEWAPTVLTAGALPCLAVVKPCASQYTCS